MPSTSSGRSNARGRRSRNRSCLENPIQDHGQIQSSSEGDSQHRRPYSGQSSKRPLRTNEITQIDPSSSRQKRRRLLKQHKSVWRGAALLQSSQLECGQFPEPFIEALKVSHPGRSYYGAPSFECSECKAVFWHAERVHSHRASTSSNVIYNKCCKGGKVKIPPFPPRPEPLASLAKFGGNASNAKFMRNIRQYNCLFSFTSMGAQIDRSINDGRGPPIFKICGQIHHRIGSLLPPEGQPPKFIQLYVYDTSNEIANRMRALNSESTENSDLDPNIVDALARMLDDHNPLAQQFRMARDILSDHPSEEISICIVAPKPGDPPQYSLPSVSELALLVVGDFNPEAFERDIIIQKKSKSLHQISALHPAFMPLQYPLLFPYGERGFQTDVLYHGIVETTENAHTKMTMQDYFCYMFHYRRNQPNPYLCYGLLSSQAKVDARACVEESRLRWILDHQKDIRCASIQGICDAVNRGLTDGNDMGKTTILPASYIGGRRYMLQNYYDGLAICREYGPPDFFVTFTCNPKWLEITEGIFEHGQKANDRHDLIVRVFHMKLEELLNDIKSGIPFGRSPALLHTVEFQKRGLPHAHIILWAPTDAVEPTPSMIDKYVSAEIPDPKIDPLGYVLVAEHMIHGPCGYKYPSCPCMKNNKCSKHYPKAFLPETTVNKDGFAVYKRPQNGLFVQKNGVRLDNRWVVPYNMFLLKKYQAHINVEWCNRSIFIKYLFKYVTKGADCSKMYLQRVRRGESAPYHEETQTVNEVKEYLNCRYICEDDAIWRILGYDIHRHHPAVERLVVHLLDDNYITFSAKAKMDKLIDVEFLRRTMLTQWFYCNEHYAEARTLTYTQFPTMWLWDPKDRKWTPRKKQQGKIGRLHYVHPSAGERYYLRMLLLVVKGARSFEELRFHNRMYHPTFKEACRSRGLLGDDQEWYQAFDEAILWASSSQLRNLFVTMLLFCEVSNELALFERVWPHLIDDIQRRYRNAIGDPSQVMSESLAKDYLLDELSILFAQHGKDIATFNLPAKSHQPYPVSMNRLIHEELSYPHDVSIDMENPTLGLNLGQSTAFNTIVQRVHEKEPGFFFVSGYGGTGKTFLWNRLVGFLRNNNHIVLTVASSGVAALLLPGGRTAHSRFKIPCDPEDDTVCDVSRGTMLSELLEKTSLIIWDEALMTDRRAFEALDRTLRDINSTNNTTAASVPFGGKVVVLGGDLRQILPVVEGGSREEIVDAAITNSYLWRHVEILTLTENMRITASSDDPEKLEEVARFSKWILDIGEGKIEAKCKEGESEPTWITIPEDLLIHQGENNLSSLINTVYPNLTSSFKDAGYLSKRAILTPTNDLTDAVNNHIVSLLPGTPKEYLSADSIAKTSGQYESFDVLYTSEYLNSISGNNFPQHQLLLKEGIPIMLLRNLNQTAGLCNGTRLIITSLGDWTIEAKIMNGRFANTRFAIPRIKLCLRTKKLPFVLERRQFPVRVCYAMTINKSQGQTLSSVGIYLKRPVFSHGQLYVALSRATTRNGLKICIEDDDGNACNETRNIVYKEVLQYLPQH